MKHKVVFLAVIIYCISFIFIAQKTYENNKKAEINQHQKQETNLKEKSVLELEKLSEIKMK